MDILWRGSWPTRLRIGSGLIIFTFVLFHLLNIGLGLVSADWMDRAQDWRQVVSRSLPGTVLLYAAMMVHVVLALARLAGRNSLRMPFTLALQTALGLAIPLLAIVHIVHTRVAAELFGVNDRMGYLIALIWNTPSAWKQSLLLLIVWTHGCIGLHYWLRLKPWWRQFTPYLIGVAVLVPAAALAGFMTEGRRITAAFANPDARAVLMQTYHWPDAATFGALANITAQLLTGFWAMLGLAVLIYAGRKVKARMSQSVQIRYVDGPIVTSREGPTLLEISQANGVPHMSLCGGRGRCTTCRVIVEEGADTLPPPNETEQRSLEAVNAGPGTRLACQMHPCGQTTVFRVFRPEGGRQRAHASLGKERRLAILFLDMRGFTARTKGQLPYDVVFLLNRFFDAIVPPIVNAGGSVDKYLGDGLLAVFETNDETSSARAALKAASEISVELEKFNQKLTSEGGQSVHIGIGLHFGNLVLGEIGAAGNAPRTIIGDSVNVASRLEGKTKDLGVEALISADLLQAAGVDTTDLDLTTLDLRGVAEPVHALAVRDWAVLNAFARPSNTGQSQGADL